MTTAQPDPLAFGGRPDPGPNSAAAPPAPDPTPPPQKRPLQGLWTAADGSPGPADWRKSKGTSRTFLLFIFFPQCSYVKIGSVC